jgi:ABC-type branched-subunit amino acid transport system ATPase component
MAETVLHINNLSKAFVRSIKTARHKEDIEKVSILKHLDLCVKKGEITALIGGNGSGKTTLFNIINGFVEADQGSIQFINEKAHELIGKKPDAIARLGLGRSFQSNHIFDELSILENMLVAQKETFGETPFISLIAPGKIKKMEEAETARAHDIFEKIFGAGNYFWENKDAKAKNLSHGQRRILGIMRIFMADFKLVLLDEPTAGVNPELFGSISNILQTMTNEENISVFIIEHNMSFVKQIASQCLFLHEGRIEARGTPSQVIDDPIIQKTYLGL